MPTRISLRAQESRVWRWLIRKGHLCICLAACLLTTVIMSAADDSMLGRGQAQRPAVQQSMPVTPDAKTDTTNGADSACIVKSSDAAIVTKTGVTGSAEENAGQGMSKASSEAPRREDMTLPAPSRDEWDNEQIHLSLETKSREESRSEKSKTVNAGSDLKCTTQEATPKPEPAVKN
jgi:hypothetical protein